MTYSRTRIVLFSIACSLLITSFLQTSTIQRTDRIYTHQNMDLNLMPGIPAKILVSNQNGSQNTTTLSPTNVEIALDMDGVAVDLSLFDKSVGVVWNNREIATEFAIEWIRDGIKYLYSNETGKALTLASDIDFDNGAVTKQALEKYKEGLGHIVDDIIDKKHVKRGMIKVLCALNGSSFVIRPTTNQPIEEYSSIAKRFPDFFGMLAPGSHGFLNEKQELIRKPNQDYFKTYINTYNIKSSVYNKTGQRFAVFIDDRIENVHAAAQAGLIAIHFVGINELIEDLNNLGLPTPSRLNDF